MNAFLQKYGIAIFVLVIVGVMVALASPLGSLIENTIHNEVKKFTETTVEDYEDISSKEESGSENETLEPGLYDATGNMTYSWEELIDSEKLPIQKTDIMGNPNGTTSALILNDGVLYTEVDAMAGAPFSASVLSGNLILDSSVTRINDQCFMGCTNLKSIFIPKSVVKIGGVVFADCSNLTDINYEGTKEEWNNIDLALDHPAWNLNCTATVHCSDGDIGCLTCGGIGTINEETTCEECDGQYTVICCSCFGTCGDPCTHRCMWCDGGYNLGDIKACPTCNGTGQGFAEFPQCPNCNGTGTIKWCMVCDSDYGTFDREECRTCEGSGFISFCQTCHGAGFVVCGECDGVGKVQSTNDCPDCE